jgi:hypothetical protein
VGKCSEYVNVTKLVTLEDVRQLHYDTPPGGRPTFEVGESAASGEGEIALAEWRDFGNRLGLSVPVRARFRDHVRGLAKQPRQVPSRFGTSRGHSRLH